jgi:hypothetical protein
MEINTSFLRNLHTLNFSRNAILQNCANKMHNLVQTIRTFHIHVHYTNKMNMVNVTTFQTAQTLLLLVATATKDYLNSLSLVHKCTSPYLLQSTVLETFITQRLTIERHIPNSIQIT